MPATDERLDAYATALGQLDEDGLADLLHLRPDVVWSPLPATLRDLAERLDDPTGLAGSVRALSLPAQQVLVVLMARGRTSAAQLAGLLGAPGADVEPALADLLRRALVWRSGDRGEDLRCAPTLRDVVDSPLGLGPTVQEVLDDATTAPLEAALRGLGLPLPKPRNKASLRVSLEAALLDEDGVRQRVLAAPAAVREWLTSRVGAAQPDPFARYDAVAYRLEHQALRWAQEHGLALPHLWGQLPVVPSEVLLALNGPGPLLTFAGQEPPVATSPVDPAAVASAGAAALSELLATATAVVDEVSRSPLALLRSGGVGSRELNRTAKALGVGTGQVRMALELLSGLEVFAVGDDDRLHLEEAAEVWRDQDPPVRAAALLSAWLASDDVITAPSADGRARPALADEEACGLCVAARLALLAALRELGPTEATTVEDAVGRVRWRAPGAHAGSATDHGPLTLHWQEAELLGIVAAGALTPAGRLLLTSDLPALTQLLTDALPATVGEVLFGADLTAVVPGDPASRLTRLLDACADREGRGGAVVWRFSPGSVRRALDTGTTSSDLLERLEAVAATGGLPQPLRYLVGDVARTHGSLRVRPAVSVLRCEDVALLAQVCADRALRKHGLALAAPTVATATVAPDVLLAALRGAGYLPMPEDASGTLQLQAPGAGDGAAGQRRSRRDERRRQFEDYSALFTHGPGALADGDGGDDLERLDAEMQEALAAAGLVVPGRDVQELDVRRLARSLLRTTTGRQSPTTGAPPRGGGAASGELARLSRRLPPAQRTLLAQAVDTRGSVEIDYESAKGARSTRVITDVLLVGDALHAWCQRADDQRIFTIERIRAVRRVTG